MNVHEITLDVSKEPAHEPSLYIAQGDKNGTTLKVNVYDNGQALTLTSYTVSFCMRSPDAQDYYEVAGTVSGNVATFLIDETYAAGYPGITEIAYINIINGTSNITSSSRLRVVVLPSAKEGVVPAPAYVSEIDQFIDDAQGQIDAAVDQAEDAAADALEAAEEAREAAGGTIPLMSSTQRGGAKLGDGLEVGADEKLSVKKATTTQAGSVKPDGTTITVDPDGTLHGSSGYSLPTMSPTTKGGAKLGSGLSMDGDALNLGPLTDSGSGASVETDGCGIFGVTGEGWSEQDTTTGKNLLPVRLPNAASQCIYNGVTYTLNNDGSITVNGTANGDSECPVMPAYSEWVVLPDATYTLSGCPSGGSESSYHIRVWSNNAATFVGRDSGSGFTFTFNTSSMANITAFITIMNGTTVENLTFYPQLELGSTATSYEPYTGGKASPNPDYPQEIRVARGRNLWNAAASVSGYIDETAGEFHSQTGYLNRSCLAYTPVQGGSSMTISLLDNLTTTDSGYTSRIVSYDSSKTFIKEEFKITTASGNRTPWTHTFTLSANAAFVRCTFCEGDTARYQLEKGSTPTPYVPYGHIGLDITANGQTTTTPIPLPAKGFLGALPDGTKDTLTIDSAGGVVVRNATNEAVMDGTGDNYSMRDSAPWGCYWVALRSSIRPFDSGSTSVILATHLQASTYNVALYGGVDGFIGINSDGDLGFIVDSTITNTTALKSWLAANPITLLYPLATPTTESLGYIQLPELPNGATVSIPELETIGVEWWVEGAEAMAEHGRDVSKANKEQEDRIAELEAAVANLATS